MPVLQVAVFSPPIATGTVPLLMAGFATLMVVAVCVLLQRPPALTHEGSPLSEAERKQFRVGKACVLIVLFVCMAPLLYGILTIDEREPARRAMCHNNLKQIGLAMHKYHDEHGCFPPAYVTDEEGEPLYSWRVLILPYMDRRDKDLHARFHLDEPWDSPANLEVLEDPDVVDYHFVYHCPSDDDTLRTETNYVMILGEEGLSSGPDCVTRDQITDHTSGTIMVVEVVDSGIRWTEPRDLQADRISFRINDPDDPGMGSRHPGCANFLFCDGHVRSIGETPPPDVIRALVTIAGGEGVSPP